MLLVHTLAVALLGSLATAMPLDAASPEEAALAKRQFCWPGFCPRPTTTATPPTATPPPTGPTFPGGGGGGSSSQTRNDVDNGVCRDVSVVYARGTSEPGNVGYSTGPSFFDALSSQLGASRVAVQGVA